MELWDLLDNDRRPTGEQHPRGTALPEGRYHIIIGVWTIHRGLRRVLLTKRSPEKLICPNKWENTGGSIVSGEGSCEGAAREVREETGMNCHCEDLHKITSIRIPEAFVDCYIHYTDIPEDGIVLQDGETVDYRWCTLDDIQSIIDAGTFATPEIEQFNACRPYLAEALTTLA